MNQINNSKKIYHAAIYVRLSKEDGDVATAGKRESNSISNQKDLIKNFLKDKKDIVVVSERVDDGYSGSNFERPAFQMMLEDIKKGIVDCVVVKDLSRFGREYIDAGKYIERLFPALGVRFIAVNDHYDSLEGKSQADEIVIPFKNLINDASLGVVVLLPIDFTGASYPSLQTGSSSQPFAKAHNTFPIFPK